MSDPNKTNKPENECKFSNEKSLNKFGKESPKELEEREYIKKVIRLEET